VSPRVGLEDRQSYGNSGQSLRNVDSDEMNWMRHFFKIHFKHKFVPHSRVYVFAATRALLMSEYEISFPTNAVSVKST
jgi:hypothetical protein